MRFLNFELWQWYVVLPLLLIITLIGIMLLVDPILGWVRRLRFPFSLTESRALALGLKEWQVTFLICVTLALMGGYWAFAAASKSPVLPELPDMKMPQPPQGGGGWME